MSGGWETILLSTKTIQKPRRKDTKSRGEKDETTGRQKQTQKKTNTKTRKTDAKAQENNANTDKNRKRKKIPEHEKTDTKHRKKNTKARENRYKALESNAKTLGNKKTQEIKENRKTNTKAQETKLKQKENNRQKYNTNTKFENNSWKINLTFDNIVYFHGGNTPIIGHCCLLPPYLLPESKRFVHIQIILWYVKICQFSRWRLNALKNNGRVGFGNCLARH